jgi:hypothetical protein
VVNQKDHDRLADFITHLLKEFAEKIRLEKKESKVGCRCDACKRANTYNQAIADLDALIAELLKGASSK